ncbi:camp-regulated phospho protein/endosulfine conserved region-domain-containing protein [Kockovaella imperatae]|uniref:mRNA stability protein n=1 Tax=Kockovaella imperatae TaxID=4999 RepID=A0A1Y1UG61_9TREE|nr:camp-regulated phospho protein/endosulfine conserved region-domain-containing protein [Kockovaella imperatae]ORX36517.1 camp-regulated phospho protein/endosulfine conserved region-domain-containing protein [Kockovaella imperatae]
MALTLPPRFSQNKVDVSSMSPQEQKAFQMYGKAPAKNLLTKMQKDRKYFDSGDYMMNKAGVNTNGPLGTAIPTPEGVPHASPPGPTSPPPNLSSSPTGSGPTPQTNLMSQNDRASSPTDRLSPQGSNSQYGNGVGVGISPAATSEAMEVPVAQHHRRTSDSNHGTRISPPSTLRDHHSHSSSFPIQHPGGFGSSPVKASSLAKRLDEHLEA